MANRWERGKLGPYTMPQDFTEGGVALNGINNVTPKVENFLLPAGTLVWFDDAALVTEEANLVIPSGQTLSRSTYNGLFNVIGELFGAGDGSTTFDLPNLTYTASRAAGSAAASGIGQFQVATMWDHNHLVDRPTGTGAVHSVPLTGDQPITEDRSLTIGSAPSALQHAQVKIQEDFTGPNPLKPPLEARYLNSQGTFASETYKLFPAWTTKATGIPLGGIVSFMGSDDLTPFPGYLLCNGQSVSSTQYPQAALIGITTTPDLRGYFIAGIVAPETRVYNSRIAAHRHRYTATPTAGVVSYSPLLNPGSYSVLSPHPGIQPVTGVNYSSRNTGAGFLGPGNETRPVNMSVNYFMRVV